MPTTSPDRAAARADHPSLFSPASPRVSHVIDVQSHHHAGFITVCGHLVLQRRGSTAVREAVPKGRGYVSVRRDERPGAGWCLEAAGGGDPVRSSSGLSEAEACSLAVRRASLVAGTELRLAPFTAAYMYTGLRPGAGLERDRIVSPLLYEPGSDTVRTAGTDTSVVSFGDGRFASAAVCEEPEALDAWSHVRHALAVGFPGCDRERGDDHCKRRLAWLAGALWLDRAHFPLRCGVLRLDMSAAPPPPAGEGGTG